MDTAAENAARLQLADRIAGLPGIRTVDNGAELLPGSVTVFLANDTGPARKRTPPVTLCVISRDGLVVHGLTVRERRHLITQGWGTPCNERIRLDLPRDEREVEVCWTILEHAHAALLNISARSRVAHGAYHGSLPRFSRTTLQ